MVRLLQRTPGWLRWIILVGIGGLATAGLALPLPSHYHAPWIAKGMDLSHLPTFAAIGMALSWVLRRGWLAFVLTVLLAAAGEVMQGFVGRSMAFSDLVAGALGAGCGWIVYGWLRSPAPRRNMGWRLAGLAALSAWPMVDAMPTLIDGYQAWRAFPVLCDFTTRWQDRRFLRLAVDLERVPPASNAGQWAGRLELYPSTRHSSGLAIYPVKPDWSQYSRLKCEFAFTGEPLTIGFLLYDHSATSGNGGRYELRRPFAAGRHQVTLELRGHRSGNPPRPLDLASIRMFVLAFKPPAEERSALLYRVWLE